MIRRCAILSVGLALLLLATPALGEEAAAPRIDPVQVGKLLLSPDAAQRERGVVLLLQRLREGGDVRVFLLAMAKAQANQAGVMPQQDVQGETLAGEARGVIERLFGEAEALRERLAADQTGAPSTATPPPPDAAEAIPAESTEAARAPAPPPPVAGQAKTRAPIVNVRTVAIQIQDDEFEQWRAAQDDPGALALLEAAARLPGAVPLFDDRFGLGLDARDLLRARSVSYREGVRRTKGGAYALRSARIPEGLSILGWASHEKGAPLLIRIQVRHTDVPRPVAVTRVRPAADVDWIEVDNPEWRTASAELTRPLKKGEKVAFTFPNVVPGKVVVIGVELP